MHERPDTKANEIRMTVGNMINDDDVYPHLDLDEKIKRCIEDEFDTIDGHIKDKHKKRKNNK